MSISNIQIEQTLGDIHIGELAQASGTSTKTIRFYEDIGLLPPAQRAEHEVATRLYGCGGRGSGCASFAMRVV